MSSLSLSEFWTSLKGTRGSIISPAGMMLAGKIEEDIFLTVFNRLEMALYVLRKPLLLLTSFVMLLEELPPSGSDVLDFDDFRGIFARNCLIIVETVEFEANNKPKTR